MEVQEGAVNEGSTQADFDAMTSDQLGTLLDGGIEGGAEAGQGEAAQVQKPAAVTLDPNTPKEPTLTELKQLLESQGKDFTALKREVGRFRALQSKLDKANEPQNKANLSPEQQTELDKAKSFIDDFIQEKYGDLIGNAKESVQSQKYQADIVSLAGEKIGELDPIMAQLIDKASQAAYGPERNDAAAAWLDRVEKEPSFLVLQAIHRMSANVQAQAAQIEQKRLAQGKKAASTLKSAPKPAAQGDPTQADFDRMSTDELGKLLDEGLG